MHSCCYDVCLFLNNFVVLLFDIDTAAGMYIYCILVCIAVDVICLPLSSVRIIWCKRLTRYFWSTHILADFVFDRVVHLVITLEAGASLQLMSLVSRCMVMCLAPRCKNPRFATTVFTILIFSTNTDCREFGGIYTVSLKCSAPSCIYNFVNSQRIFKILSLSVATFC